MQAPGPGGMAAPGQPPIGSSPASSPTPNPGIEAGVKAIVEKITGLLLTTAARLGPMSDLSKEITKAASILQKAVPSGSTSPVLQQNGMQNMLMQQQQRAPAQIAAMQGRPPMPPGGAPPTPPTPPPGPPGAAEAA